MIKVGFCVAYDWVLLKNSLPLVYAYADKICLSLDKDRKSWSGRRYDFDEEKFREWIAEVDQQKKIDVYEDCFSLENLSAIENDTRQRNMMGQRLGAGGWHVQVDSDEYFADFGGFCKFLTNLNANPTGKEKPYNVHVCIYDLFKKVPGGFLIASDMKTRPFSQPFATTQPVYHSARHNGHFNKMSPFYVVHETWSRGEEELAFKLANWGHASIELKSADVRESYLNFWRAMDRHNCKFAHNFHFAVPHVWSSLTFIAAHTIKELLDNFSPEFYISPWYLKLINTRIHGKAMQVLKKLKS